MISKVGDLFQAAQDRLPFGVVDLLAAGVVAAAFHVADFQRPGEVLLEERNILIKELLLQILGAGGDDHALAGQSAGTR